MQGSKMEAASKICPQHPKSELKFVCKEQQCNRQLVCELCTHVTGFHYNHRMIKLDEFIHIHQRKIQEHVSKINQEYQLQIKDMFGVVEAGLQTNSQNCQKVVGDVEEKAKELHQKIDQMVKKHTKNCDRVQKENEKKLINFKLDLEIVQVSLDEQMKRCQEALNSNNLKTLYQCSQQLMSSPVTVPSVPLLQTIRYADDPSLSDYHLGLSFGQLSLMSEEQSETLLSSVKSEENLTTMKRDKSLKRSTLKSQTINRDLKLLSKFEHRKNISAISVSPDDSAWVSYHGTSKIRQLNQQGQTRQKLKLDKEVLDISVSPSDGHLWISCSDHSIREHTAMRTISMKFRSEKLPLCLCVTNSNNIVVGSLGSIVLYNTEGSELHFVTDATLSCPHRIKASRWSGDIAAIIWDWGLKSATLDSMDSLQPIKTTVTSPGMKPPFLAYFDKELNLLYNYHGNQILDSLYFNPCDICFDGQDNMLIADFGHKIILVNKDGQYLRTLLETEFTPRAVGLYDDQVLWMWYYDTVKDNSHVQVVCYCKPRRQSQYIRQNTL